MAVIVTPYKNTEGKKTQVAAMFNNIAHRYDFLNQLLSLGIHKLWRKKAIALIKEKKIKKIIDIATGTADFAIEAMKLNPDKIIGIDISERMLELGRKKVLKKKLEKRVELMLSDSENISFPDHSFDAAIVAFGVRNFENLEKGLGEIFRVLDQGGVISVLEFSKPRKFPIKQLYNLYFKKVTPFVGKLFSKDSSAYSYLPESVNLFPDGENFLAVMRKIGFKNAKCHRLTFGIASIYIAEK